MESNLSIIDWCLACGHYHKTLDSKKDPRSCTLPKSECKCESKKFVSRSFKRKFP